MDSVPRAGSNGPSPFGGEGGGIAEWNDTMWDKLYGGEEDDDVGDMSQQSSMIGHLLSQVGFCLNKISFRRDYKSSRVGVVDDVVVVRS